MCQKITFNPVCILSLSKHLRHLQTSVTVIKETPLLVICSVVSMILPLYSSVSQLLLEALGFLVVCPPIQTSVHTSHSRDWQNHPLELRDELFKNLENLEVKDQRSL